MNVDERTLDAIRVVRNLAATSGLDLDAAEWECLRIVTDELGLAKNGVVSHPIERFRAKLKEGGQH